VRRALDLLVVIGCAGALSCVEGDVLTRLSPPEPVVPRAADDLVDSIGITILRANDDHFPTIELPALERLGVRHVRDWALPPVENAEQVAMLQMLGELGIRSHLIFEPRFDVLPEHFMATASALGDALESIEGPNDNDAGDIDLSADEVIEYLRALRIAIDDAGLAGQVALVDALDIEPEDKGDLSEILDYGNFERDRDRALPALDLSDRKDAARLTCGAKPLMVTECGYSTTDGDTSVSEAAAAKYLLRLVLGHFEQNIARTYIDELMDGPDDPSLPFMAQGLLNIDGSEKPAFGALQRLLELLADEGEPFEPVPLELRLEEETDQLRQLLLQKRDGSYALILWQEVESFDGRSEGDVEVEPRTVLVALDTPAVRIRVHEPLHGKDRVASETDLRELEVSVADHPSIVLIER